MDREKSSMNKTSNMSVRDKNNKQNETDRSICVGDYTIEILLPSICTTKLLTNECYVAVKSNFSRSTHFSRLFRWKFFRKKYYVILIKSAIDDAENRTLIDLK